MVEGRNNGGVGGFRQGWEWIGQKRMRGLLSVKQMQRRDVLAQRRDVEIKRLYVTERVQIQHRDVLIQRCDVPERL